MIESHTAVVARNDVWTGFSASEPYECGWAKEAIVWLRVLAADGELGTTRARVQISPDGIRWTDEGALLPFPAHPEAVSFARVDRFGNWLRLVADLPAGTTAKVLVSLTLKG